MKHVLVMLVLSAAVNAQSYTVIFDGHAAHVDSGGAQKLEFLQDGVTTWQGDVTAHGDEVVVMNGALENYVGSITGDLVIADSKTGDVLHEVEDLTIHDGCGYVWGTKRSVAPPDEQAWIFLERYYAGAPDPSFWPASVLSFDEAGPNPDDADPGQTGSTRVAWNRYSPGYIVLARHTLGLPIPGEMWDELIRWGLTDWGRSQNYYAAEDGYQSWRRRDYPNSVLGAYRADVTFTNNYGSTELFGRPLGDAPGNWPLDVGHADNAMSTVLYALTGSWAAAKAAENDCHVVFGQHEASGYWLDGQRSAGWPLRCAALYYGATRDPVVIPYLDDMLGNVTKAQNDNPGFSYVRVPYEGQPSANGYINDDVWFKDLVLGWNDAFGSSYSSTALSAGSSIWQEGILGISLLLAYEFAPEAMQTGFAEASKRCAYTVFVRARQPALTQKDVEAFVQSAEQPFTLGNVQSSFSPSPPTNDVGMPLFGSHTVGGRGLDLDHVFMVGVGSATVLPFGIYFSRVFPSAGASSLVAPVSTHMVEYLYGQNYWGFKTPEPFLLDRGIEWLGVHSLTSDVFPGKGWDP